MIRSEWDIVGFDEKPIGEGVQGGDDHERGFGAEEDSNDNDQHQCCALRVALSHLNTQSFCVLGIFVCKSE